MICAQIVLILPKEKKIVDRCQDSTKVMLLQMKQKAVFNAKNYLAYFFKMVNLKMVWH